MITIDIKDADLIGTLDGAALALTVIDEATIKEKQVNAESGTLSWVYILDRLGPNGGGYIFVVKATKSGEALLVTSFRRLSRNEAMKEKVIAKILEKGGAYHPSEH